VPYIPAKDTTPPFPAPLFAWPSFVAPRYRVQYPEAGIAARASNSVLHLANPAWNGQRISQQEGRAWLRQSLKLYCTFL